MSSMGDEASKRAEAAQQQQKGAETFLTQAERSQVQRFLKFPEEFPPKFGSWITEYLSTNFPQIQIKQITGFEKYLYKKGSSLPENPSDGQQYAYVADATQGIVWRFQYNADSGSQYKWEFIGGAPTPVTSSGGVSVTSGSYKDLGGPGLTLALPGDYLVTWGAQISNTVVGRDTFMAMGTATSAVDGDDALGTEAFNQRIAMSRSAIINVPNAGDTLKAYYRIATEDCTAFFNSRWMLVQPVRVKRA